MKRSIISIALFVSALSPHAKQLDATTVQDFFDQCPAGDVDACANYLRGSFDQIGVHRDSQACWKQIDESKLLVEVVLRLADGDRKQLLWRAVREKTLLAAPACR